MHFCCILEGDLWCAISISYKPLPIVQPLRCRSPRPSGCFAKIRPSVTHAFGSTYNDEGLTLVLNPLATLIGLFLGSRLFPRSLEEKQRTERFFVSLETPVHSSSMELLLDSLIGLALLGTGFFNRSGRASHVWTEL